MAGKLISVVEGRQDISRAESVASDMLKTHYGINESFSRTISTIFASFCEAVRDRGYEKMDVLKLEKGLTEGMMFSLFNEEELYECTMNGRCSPDRIKIVFQPEGRIELHHNEDLFEAFAFETQSKLKSKYNINVIKLGDIKAIVTSFIRALYEDVFDEVLIALNEDSIDIGAVNTSNVLGDNEGSLIGAEMITISTKDSELINL